MISNMACSLIQHKRINTTLAKAKALRVFVEPILTKSKADSNELINLSIPISFQVQDIIFQIQEKVKTSHIKLIY